MFTYLCTGSKEKHGDKRLENYITLYKNSGDASLFEAAFERMQNKTSLYRYRILNNVNFEFCT